MFHVKQACEYFSERCSKTQAELTWTLVFHVKQCCESTPPGAPEDVEMFHVEQVSTDLADGGLLSSFSDQKESSQGLRDWNRPAPLPPAFLSHRIQVAAANPQNDLFRRDPL